MCKYFVKSPSYYTPVAPLGLNCAFQNRGYKPLPQEKENA